MSDPLASVLWSHTISLYHSCLHFCHFVLSKRKKKQIIIIIIIIIITLSWSDLDILFFLPKHGILKVGAQTV